jgi:hypothetical protein
MSSKPEVEGDKLMQRVLHRDPDHGGVLAEITGAQGTSKTASLFSFAKYTLKKYPKEKIFFREQTEAPLQCYKLGEGNFEFFIKESANVTFHDRTKRLKKVEIPYKTFTTYEELYEKARGGIVSIPFFDTVHEWMDFIHYLRSAGEWITVIIDEMADICPYGSSADLYKKIKDFAGDMGAVRRCMLNVFYNTQSAADIDWRVRKKVMLSIYFRGATAKKTSRVKQHAIDALDVNHKLGNEAWLDMGGEFGKVRFATIFAPDHKHQIEVRRS